MVTTVEVPARSLEQRLTALEKANAVRSYRAELKRDVTAGRKSVSTLISEPGEMLETMKVFDLLMTIPKCGRVKVNRILVRNRISPSKTLGGMSERQRGELLMALRAFAPHALR